MRLLLLLFLVCALAKKVHHKTSFLGNQIPLHSHTQTDHVPVSSHVVPTAKLVAKPATIANGEEVYVRWSSVPNPSQKDVIAIYCPPSGDPSDFLDSTLTNGTASGEVVFEGLINMRCDYSFQYLQYVNGGFVAIAKSNLVVLADGPTAPLHGHISLTGDETEMRVMWNSALFPNRVGVPLVKYGASRSTMFNVESGSSSTYAAEDMCGPPATVRAQQWFRDPGYTHDVLLTGLQPATTYWYSYGLSTTGQESDVLQWSEVSQFTTAPEVGPEVGVSFVAFGDMGVDNPPAAYTTASRIAATIDDFDFLLHFGDISYARGAGYVWDAFFHLIEPIARRIAYMVSIGNHEYDHTSGADKDPSGAGLGFHPSWGNYGDDSSGECGLPMYKRMHMPDTGFSLWWYSFNYGNTHIIMISTEHNYTQGSALRAWLEQDLSSVDRTKTPFVVLAGHRPMYTSENCTDDPSASDYYVGVGMMAAFEDIIYKYQVDLALWGHQHSYERTCPVYKQHCVDDGVTHIVVGTAGAGLEPGEFVMGNAKEWSAFHWVNWGYLTVSTTADAMTVQLLSNIDNSIVEQLVLPNKYPSS